MKAAIADSYSERERERERDIIGQFQRATIKPFCNGPSDQAGQAKICERTTNCEFCDPKEAQMIELKIPQPPAPCYFLFFIFFLAFFQSPCVKLVIAK